MSLNSMQNCHQVPNIFAISVGLRGSREGGGAEAGEDGDHAAIPEVEHRHQQERRTHSPAPSVCAVQAGAESGHQSIHGYTERRKEV